ncbi:MAG: hypothetical protein AAF653_21710 [Chloroflexota bacterium]
MGSTSKPFLHALYHNLIPVRAANQLTSGGNRNPNELIEQLLAL